MKAVGKFSTRPSLWQASGERRKRDSGLTACGYIAHLNSDKTQCLNRGHLLVLASYMRGRIRNQSSVLSQC